jgi:LL-diaminopimelate aminotransferase
MWLNYPNNPTGAVADLNFLAQVVDYARRHNLLLCHDAPYCEVGYDGYVAPSVLQVSGASEVAVEFNSLSKMANMAGWRVGMAVGNAQAVSALGQVKSNIDSGIFRPLQEAAVEALSLDQAWLAERNAIYQERMQIVVQAVTEAGMPAPRPRATLYVWAPIPPGWTSEGFGLKLLGETGVAVAPGSFFGRGGAGYVRISVTAPTARLREAMARLVRFVETAEADQGGKVQP